MFRSFRFDSNVRWCAPPSILKWYVRVMRKITIISLIWWLSLAEVRKREGKISGNWQMCTLTDPDTHTHTRSRQRRLGERARVSFPIPTINLVEPRAKHLKQKMANTVSCLPIIQVLSVVYTCLAVPRLHTHRIHETTESIEFLCSTFAVVWLPLSL